MRRKPRGKVDPIERQIEATLRPGEFIHDRACISFVSGLEKVAANIGKVTAREPARSVTLCEAFLAGCHAKAEELDDSSGSFGQFAQDLICLWIKARRASGADPQETAATLLAWIDDDPAFENLLRARFEAVASGEQSGYAYRQWSDVLRAIYLAQRNIAAYVALAGQTGLTPQDCLALGTLLATRKPNEALAWVERGIAIDRKGLLHAAHAAGRTGHPQW